MDDQPTIHQMPTRQMELDILKTVHELGPIHPVVNPPAIQRIRSKYDSERENEQVTVVLNYLLEERLLFPYFSGSTGEEQRNTYARGITPKGLERLDRLQHPVRTWIYDNWFGVVVASITALIGIANAVISILSR